MKKETCGLCDRDYPINQLAIHPDFHVGDEYIDICKGCLESLQEIKQYGIDEADEFINKYGYIDYKLKDEGTQCPGAWLARSLELKAEAALYA